MVVFLLLPHSANTTILTQGQENQPMELEPVEVSKTLTSGAGNDIYFKSNIDNALLSHAYHSTETSYDLYSYDETKFTDLGGFDAFDDFTARDPNVLYHASNFTTGDQSLNLTYSVTYYDLTNGNSELSGIENVKLVEDEMSGFRFNAEANEPLILDIKIEGASEVLRMNLFLISPTGEVFDYSAYSTAYRTFVNEFIPIVPTETGEYTVYLSPLNEDITLEEIHIFSSPPVEKISEGASGFIEKLTGTITQTRFFEMDLSNETDSTILEIDFQQFKNISIPFNDPTFLLGSLDIEYFTPLTGPFGASLPATVLQGGQTKTFVAVTATPPNENNQFVVAEKKELGLRPGFDLDYAFWAEQFDLEEFTLNENLLVEDPDQPNSNFYYFNSSKEQLIGMNATTAAGARIVDLNNPTNVFQIDSNNNNIRDIPSHEPMLLPPGDYAIYLFDSEDNEDAQVYTLDIHTISLGEEINRFLSLNQVLFFKLAALGPNREYFDLTYLGRNDANASVEVDFRLYDSRFQQTYSDTYNFREYYSAPTTRESFNNTQFGSTSTTNQYNIQQGFMRLSVIGNNIYENPSSTPTSTNNASYTARFSIQRLNYLDIWAETDTNQYESTIFTTSVNEDLNGSKSTIILVYKFTSETTESGYRFKFSAIDATYTIRTFVDWTDSWHTINVDTPLSGTNMYNHDLEFGTNIQTNFGFVVILSPSGDGVFSLGYGKFEVQDTPGITIGSISTEKYQAPYEITPSSDEDFLDENLIPVGIAGAVVVIGAGALVITRRRAGGL
jgi:hypothetical protein